MSWALLEIPGAGSTAPGAGKLYAEGGHALPAYDPAMSYTTRRMYLNGMTNEVNLRFVYAYMAQQSGNPRLAYTLLSTKTEFAGEQTFQAPEIELTGQLLHSVNLTHKTEGARIRMDVVADHNDMGAQLLILDAEDFGEQDSGI